MSSEKRYPLTAKKKEKLKNKGIFPYSQSAHLIITTNIVTVILFYLFQYFFNQTINTANTEHSLLNSLFTLPLLITFIIYIIHTVVGLTLTKATILSLGRYPETRLARKTSNIYSILISSVSFLLIFALFSNPMEISNILKTLRIQNLLNSSERVLIKISTLGLIIGILIVVLNKIRYDILHKMSKQEIEIEIKEDQMSTAAKKLISRSIKEQL